jgi:hypothetical protein
VRRLALVLLVDALRADYPRRAPFIRALADEGVSGRLREDFGFVPRAAYFGGLTADAFGYTNMFSCDPAASPFGIARGLPASGRGRGVEDRLGIRRRIEDEARARVTPFAASYISTCDIPLDLLPFFDLVEQRAPWDPRVGYRSIFARLQERGDTFFHCAWPETNLLPDHSDRGIVEHALAHVTPADRLAYVHLQELDALGHAYGPESAEVQTCLQATDALVERLVTTLQARFDAVDVLLFGDHGMVPVTGTTDVSRALAATGLRMGTDYLAFLDSSMVRFWFFSDGARRRVAAALDGLPGRLLDDKAQVRYGIAGCDRRNGEAIFLAEPGVLVFPNFFQREGALVKGMHGYDPDCPDNQGFFAVRRHDRRDAGDAGMVGPTAVHAALEDLLELGGRVSPRLVLGAKPIGPASVRFTERGDADVEALVDWHMARIVMEVTEAADLQAIVLTGSFGRGEGGVVRNADRSLSPVNDYDVLLISAHGDLARLKALEQTLPTAFGIDYVHFSHWTHVDPHLPPTLANFDIRYGSRVLMGREDVLEALPAFGATDIPVFEGVQLLCNRIAGLLTGLRGRFLAGGTPTPDERRYLTNQHMKALMALGDWCLIRAGGYDTSYRTRLTRFTWLAPGLGLAPALVHAVQGAYEFKLRPEYGAADDTVGAVFECAPWLLDALETAVGLFVRHDASLPLECAMARYYSATVGASEDPAVLARQSIYAAIPLLFAAAARRDDRLLAGAIARLPPSLQVPDAAAFTPETWEAVRDVTASAWLSLVH